MSTNFSQGVRQKLPLKQRVSMFSQYTVQFSVYSSYNCGFKFLSLKLTTFFFLFALFVFQSLRYPYFHVGQALGAPLKHSEQHKAQAEMSEAPTEPTPQPLYKTELQSSEANMSQTESQTYSQSPHQPLKQIPLPQENIEQSTKQAVAPKTRTEGQQEPLSLVKNRKPMSGHSGGITEVLTLYDIQ